MNVRKYIQMLCDTIRVVARPVLMKISDFDPAQPCGHEIIWLIPKVYDENTKSAPCIAEHMMKIVPPKFWDCVKFSARLEFGRAIRSWQYTPCEKGIKKIPYHPPAKILKELRARQEQAVRGLATLRSVEKRYEEQ